MLVKLRNDGDAQRIVYDINTVQRSIRPGQELEVDLQPKAVKKFEAAYKSGDSMEVMLVEDYPEGDEPETPRQAERQEEFTHGQDGGLEHVEQPRSRGQIEQPARHHTDGDEQVERRLDPQDTNNGNKPPAEGRVRIKPDKLKQVAKNANRAKGPDDKPIEPPKTATDLLDRARNFSEDEFISHANAVLPRGALPMRPKPTQIMAALRKQAQAEARKRRPDADPH